VDVVSAGLSAGLVEAYLSRLALAGFRPQTLKARKVCLSGFATSLAPRGLSEATRLDVEAYIGRDLKPATRRAYRDHLNSFYRWALEEEYVPVNPVAKLPPVRVPDNVPRPISEDDLLTALAGADARTRAWLVLMALGGLRCIEVAHLRPQDLVPGGAGTLLYLRECKGGGQAHVPAHPLILRALDDVPIRNGLWWSITPKNLSTTLNRYLRSVGLSATAHQLRHYAGTNWYRASGHDLLTTAALLRHRNVKTTMVYAALDPTRPAEVVNAVELPGVNAGTPAASATPSGRPNLRAVEDAS
jgi:integrase/recombinase XerD